MTYYLVTFCFSIYDPDRAFSWMNWAAHVWDGPCIHCEVYDRTEERGYYITQGTKTIVKERRFYGDTGWEFITVALDYTEYSRMIDYFEEQMALSPSFSKSNIYCFPFLSCCDFKGQNTMTCSELVLGMITRVWEKQLLHAAHLYTPGDVRTIVYNLVYDRTMKKSVIQGNPNALAHNVGGLVED